MAGSTTTTTPLFTLNPTLFNQTLYSRLLSLWFADVSSGADAPSQVAAQRWYGAGWTEQQKAAFDGECKDVAGPALASLAPGHVALPERKSYEEELENADYLAAPFLNEVDRVTEEKGRKEGAETLLALLLLLDQMPRNIFREEAELPLIYNHYDRLAFAFARSSLASNRTVVMEPSLRRRHYWSWQLLPLTHAEHLPSHDLLRRLDEEWDREFPEPTTGMAAVFAKGSNMAREDHYKPLKQFGRYPHRNKCLGRQNTPEEEEFLKTAKTFGVKQGSNKKDEEAGGRSEL